MAKKAVEKADKLSLIERIKAKSTIKETDILSETKFFSERKYVQIAIPELNIALSGDLDGGLSAGLTMFAGPSKHFKTLFSLILAKAYLDSDPDAVMILLDSEFGSPLSYFRGLKIDMNRVVHIPVTDIEHLKIELTQQIDGLERGDKVVIVVDSVGNIASIKEVEDALNNKIVTDMSRAKALKSLFRIVSPRCVMKGIPFIVINHTYKEQSLFPKDVVSGGTGSYYNSDNLFIIGRQQDKEDKIINGYNFTLKVEKSRYVKENSKFNVTVTFDKGIYKWSGMLDHGMEAGMFNKPKAGYYHYIDDPEDVIYKEDKIPDIVFERLIKRENFKSFIKDKFQLSETDLLNEEDGVINEEISE